MSRHADPAAAGASPGASQAASSSGRRSLFLLAAVAGGVFVAADDQTSVVTILPAIISDIGITVDDFYRGSWIINGYLLGYLVALPIVGRVADVYGHARVYAAALAIFMLGSALVAVAPGLEWLVAARVLQAVGGGAVVPVSMAIVIGELPPARRALGLGAIAAASEAGALIGPLWGGVITQWFGWRWVFASNLPMTLPFLLGAWWLAGRSRGRGTIDWWGATLLGGALAAFTVALVDDPVDGRPLLFTAALFLLALGLVVAFVHRERTVAEPLLRLSMFRARPVWSANLASLLVGGGLITMLMTVPLFVNLVLQERPLDGGLTLLRLTAAVPVGALLGGWLAGRWSIRNTVVVGMTLTALGFVGMLSWDIGLTEFERSAPQIVAGFGFGLVIAPLGTAVLQRVDEAERATAAAWLTLSRVLGMLVGAAMLSTHGLGRFYARAGSIDFDSPEFESLIAEAQVSTFQEVFAVAAVALAVAALVALLIGGGRAAAGAWRTLP